MGTWLFGGKRWGKVVLEESIETLKCALDMGINFFDTADAYGIGLSEKILGDLLFQRRKEVVIATKVGVVWRDDGSRYHDLSPAHIEKAVYQSLKRLRTDYIDLYHLHEMDGSTPVEETGAALKKLLDQGIVRYIGVSNFDIESIERLKAVVSVLTNQEEYSLLKREIEKTMVPFCERNGISLLTYTPLYRGLLTGKFTVSSRFPEDDNRYQDEEFSGGHFRENIRKVNKLVKLSREIGKLPSQVALRWLLENKNVQAVIFGARRPEQLKENIGSVEWTLSRDSYEFLSNVFN